MIEKLTPEEITELCSSLEQLSNRDLVGLSMKLARILVKRGKEPDFDYPEFLPVIIEFHNNMNLVYIFLELLAPSKGGDKDDAARNKNRPEPEDG